MPSALVSALRRLRYGKPVVVVSGLPRSGTSLVMQMLAAGGMPLVADGVREADEDNPRGYLEDERVKQLDGAADKRWVRSARGRAIKVISFLLKDLPADNNYRVVFVQRDAVEILASQRKMLARRGETSTTPDARMREVYAEHLEKVARLLARGAHFTTLEVTYADVVRAPREQAERIARFVGGLDVGAMAAAVDESLYRNRAR